MYLSSQDATFYPILLSYSSLKDHQVPLREYDFRNKEIEVKLPLDCQSYCLLQRDRHTVQWKITEPEDTGPISPQMFELNCPKVSINEINILI